MSNTVPEGWTYAQLGAFVAESSAGEWGGEAAGDENDIPVIRSTNFTNRGVIDYSKLAYRNIDEKKRLRKSLKRGDMVLEKSGGSPSQPVGRVVYFDKEQPFLYSNFTQRLSPVTECDSKFLFYKFYAEYQNGTVLKFQQQTTGIINFQLAEYLGYKSVFPPLPEQQKIAAILSSVDDVIEKTSAQIDKLKDLKTGMMQELLTNGIGPDGAPHTAFKDSPVGRIPEGWGVRPLMEFSKPEKNSFVNGPFGSNLLSSELTSSGVPVIYVRDLKDHKYERVSTVCVTELKADSLPACLVEKNDVLVAKVGDPPCGAGVYEFDNRSIVTQDVIRIRPNHDVDPYYLSYLLNSPLGRKQIEKIEIAGTRTRVSLTDFKKLLMPYPSSDEQRYIGQALRSVDIKIWSLERKKLAVTGSKKALMQDLLTGKVRVKVD